MGGYVYRGSHTIMALYRVVHGSVWLGFELESSYEPNPSVSSESKTEHDGFSPVLY